MERSDNIFLDFQVLKALPNIVVKGKDYSYKPSLFERIKERIKQIF